MTVLWYHISKTGEIGSYDSDCAGYELKGILYAYGDAVTVGLKSKEEALAWAKEWGYCSKCDSSKSGKDNNCFLCGDKLVFKEPKVVD